VREDSEKRGVKKVKRRKRRGKAGVGERIRRGERREIRDG
jgi:hypothetical protein